MLMPSPWKAIHDHGLAVTLAPPYDFRKGTLPPEAFSLQHLMQCGLSKAAAKQAVQEAKQEKILVSSGYQVNIVELGRQHSKWPPLTWFSIKRRDKAVIVDRSVLCDIKNVLAGEAAEGFELYPAESRLMDTANQYHLYITQEPAPVSLADSFEPHRIELTGALSGLVAHIATIGPSIQSMRLTDAAGNPVGDWRLRQQAKNQLFTEECEGADVLPSSLRPAGEARLSGQMLVLLKPDMRFPFGFKHRMVTTPEHELNIKTGAVQRGFHHHG
jgi:hypothetical protein